jgi:nucleoside-triphosphatase
MKTVILLTGTPGSGKTTLIHNVLSKLSIPAGGFYTQEIRQAGVRLGFEIVTLDGKRGVLAHVDIHSRQRVGKYGVDIDALDRLAVPAVLNAAAQGWLVVIDEIGPMEILSASFRLVVLAALDSQAPVLASIVQRSTPFTDQVKAMPGVILLEVRRENRQVLVKQVLNSYHFSK